MYIPQTTSKHDDYATRGLSLVTYFLNKSYSLNKCDDQIKAFESADSAYDLVNKNGGR